MKSKQDKKNTSLKSKNLKNQKNSKKGKKQSKLLPIISRLMPYILAVLFVLTLFTIVGKLAFSNVLYGLFSTFASYFILVFLLYHSLMWYYDTKRKICARRVCCSITIVLAVSVIQHIAYIGKTDFVYKATEGVAVNKPTIFELYNLGKAANGGGVIGGGIGGFLLSTIGKGFSLAIILIILLFMFLQMFNITPASIIRSIFKDKIEAKKARKEEARRNAALAKKKKNFRVIVDDTDDDEIIAIDPRILEAMNEDNVALDEDEEPTIEDELQDDESDEDIFEIERQPVFEQSQPVGRSSAPYRFTAEPIVKASEADDTETGEFVLNAPTFKLVSDNENQEDEHFDDDNDELIDEYVAQNDDTAVISEPYADDDADEEYDESNITASNDEAQEIKSADALANVVKEDDSPNDNSLSAQGDNGEDSAKKSLFSSLFKRDKNGENTEKKEKAEKVEKAEKEKKDEKKEEAKPVKKKKKYIFPPIDIFEIRNDTEDQDAVNEELQEKARIIVDTLKSFNLNTRIVDISRGPTVTRYELMPEAGVKVRSISNLQDDIALYLAAEGIRMECPIPGKSAVGIEVPNSITSIVYLRSLLEDPKFKQAKSPLTCAVGKSISGENVYVDIAKLVHLLVAGATGQGKSVCINALLTSLLYKSSPDDLRLILIDPKRVEFAPYNGIPHLLVPVVTDVKKSVGTLQWSVSEMERRFATYEECGARNIEEYNDRVERGAIEGEKMPRIVIVIDELYDLKMQVPEIDDYIMRLTQKARAAGIHVIIGTQRPSVDVITGVIKANIPSRIAFRVPALVDSRTILDEAGAEKLVARGDMLLKPVGALKPIRVQGAFITETECEKITSFLRENSSENYDESVISMIESNAAKLLKAEKKNDADSDGGEGGNDLDEKFYAALEIAVEGGKISSSYLQRKLNLGFQRAARIIDQMEELGYIGEPNGSKPRDVLITKQDYLELMMRRNDEEE